MRPHDAASPPHEVAVLEESYRSGDVIAGKYRLDWEAQQGGMCHVWMAVNEALNLPVAIKFLHRELRCPGYVSYLRREARVMAVLHHPAIVQIFDSGEMSPDNPFIVMERLEGEDLRQSLEREGPWRAEDAVRLLLPIASALCAAHEHGIVHRDLKPENILARAQRVAEPSSPSCSISESQKPIPKDYAHPSSTPVRPVPSGTWPPSRRSPSKDSITGRTFGPSARSCTKSSPVRSRYRARASTTCSAHT